jgi:hypothetical protein
MRQLQAEEDPKPPSPIRATKDKGLYGCRQRWWLTTRSPYRPKSTDAFAYALVAGYDCVTLPGISWKRA